ncbi:type I restriction-modification system subunit M N-terminal domain-containing protein [Anaerophaga thermohalophila]|uniref:type I restriction-modification system subunit M N-terminal domain-containing protein n=1 Tax=Anaerophaga thermohalophila TaxID=177400 RepID=UPI0002E5A410|nr:type I restriction-modification system subunit M N-terminal domain-containing protein [Anaerophaga thermohalophila]
MTQKDQQQLGKTLWNIADQLRGAMNPDDFRDYMLFVFVSKISIFKLRKGSKKGIRQGLPRT